MSNSRTTVVLELAGIAMFALSSHGASADPPAAGPPDAPSVATASTSAPPVQPSAELLQQVRLQRLNAEVEQELARIGNEVRIEEARRTLRETRDEALPDLVATFRVDGKAFAEFQAGGTRFERTEGQWLTNEWRVARIHEERIELCAQQSTRCRVVTSAHARPGTPQR